MDSQARAAQSALRAVFAAFAAGLCLAAYAADDATITLRREHREEVLQLRQQQSEDPLPPDASDAERAQLRELQLREHAAQEQLHSRQLRQQLQSSQIRQLQEREFAAGQAQIQLQQFRRERDAQRLQQELLRPAPVPRKR